MARLKVTVKGLDELADKLDKLPEAVNGARRAVKKETRAVANDMRGNAPRRTGFLADSVQAESANNGLGGVAAATARYAKFVEYGTSDTPEQPFAAPAAEQSRRRFPDRVRDEVGADIKDLL